MNRIYRNQLDIIKDLEDVCIEIRDIPNLELTQIQKEYKANWCTQSVLNLFQELVENQEYLIRRLVHSETERFK